MYALTSLLGRQSGIPSASVHQALQQCIRWNMHNDEYNYTATTVPEVYCISSYQ